MKPDGFAGMLVKYTESRRSMPFAWGSNDCVTFSMDWVLALRGVDPIADLRGQWRDASTAFEVIKSLGGLIEAADVRFKRIPTGFAQRGDIVAIPVDGHIGLYVCSGSHAVGPGRDEMMLIDMGGAVAAWEA